MLLENKDMKFYISTHMRKKTTPLWKRKHFWLRERKDLIEELLKCSFWHKNNPVKGPQTQIFCRYLANWKRQQ